MPPPFSLSTRRTFLGLGMAGLGTLALGDLLAPRAVGDVPEQSGTDAPRTRHHPAKCKRVIFLYQAGGPSHLETFDYKPKLAKMHGLPMPDSLTKGQQIAQLQGQDLKCFGPQYDFKKFGRSGQEICSLFPKIGSVADDICIIRSMYTEQINHDPAQTFMNTGSVVPGRPSIGSWVLYGLGAETEDLPGFVVLVSQGKGGQMQPIAARQWHSGFLPPKFQGVKFQSQGDPVHYLRRPLGVSADAQREIVDTVNKLNRLEHDAVRDPEILSRIDQYETAFRMQTAVPGLLDFSDEPKATLDLYGAKPGDGSFAANCLLARRLAERGVRFIQLYHRDWDHHDDVKRDMLFKADEVDRASAALIIDLKQRGLFEETLLVWGGEFGRTPMAQGNGRDHHIRGFSIWMAGGGIKGGISYGKTDELGYAATENPVGVHDLHATVLHLLGFDHTKLTYRFQGRDFRLTDVVGDVVNGILC